MRLKKREKSLFIAAMMLFLVVATVISTRQPEQPGNQQPEVEYLGTWQGMSVYGQKTQANTSIYYLEIQPGYSVVMRADPREAEKVESASTILLYSTLYTSSRVYAVFDPEDSKEVGLAYTELAKFLANRPFEVVFATTEPYVDEANRTYPSVDPFNTSETEAVVYLRVANETGIELVNRTVVLRGEDRWNLTNAAAKLELVLMRLI